MSPTGHPPDEPFQWSDLFLLGHPQMDDTHREFVAIVGRMANATDTELPQLLDTFARHASDHFGQEDRWMVETAFPPRQCHINEHAAVLRSVQDVRLLLAGGNNAVCRRLVRELISWFPAHAQHLDSALAHWISKLRTGGKPVVIRRNMTFNGQGYTVFSAPGGPGSNRLDPAPDQPHVEGFPHD